MGWIEDGVGEFAANAAMRRSLARWIFRETAREGVITRILAVLQEHFFRYRERHPVRGFLAEQFVIDWDELRASLIEVLQSDESAEDLAEVLVGMAGAVIERLREPRAAEAIAALRARSINAVLDWFERDGVPMLAERARGLAGEPRTWELIERVLEDFAARVPEALFETGGARLRPEVREHLAHFQRRLVEVFPVAEIVEKQVLAMNPRAIEAMVDDIGARELAWIQILGLVLGALSGSVLLLL
ncbi:DUF445 family protein, partial [Candidatus Poribacteria bacterium]|nr:DUF445 family protein [Candidatus Poribacteria bacterium]